MVDQIKLPEGFKVRTQEAIQLPQGFKVRSEKPQIPSSETVIGTQEVDIQPRTDDFGFADIPGRMAQPFIETDFGFDPDTQKAIDENLSFEGKAILGPILAAGEAGLSVLEGIGATIKSGAAGLAGLARATGLFEGTGFSGATGEKKLSRDLDLLANLGLLRAGARPSVTRPPRPTAVKKPSRADVIKGAPSEQALREQTTAAFKRAEESGVAFNKQGINQLINKSRGTLEKGGVNKTLHPDATAALDEVIKLGEKESVTLSELETVRKIVGDATQSIKPADARLARLLRDEIDDFALTASKRQTLSGDVRAGSAALNEARSTFRKLKKSEIISEAFLKAGDQASGFENGLRVQFRALLRNKKTRNQFTKEEQAAMRKVIQGGPVENILRVLGSFAFSEGAAKNPLTTLAGIGAGGAVGGGVGAVAVPLIGQAARTGAQALTRRNAEFARALVRQGATREQARKAVQVKRELDKLGTFTPEAAENLARLVALGGQEASTTARQQ